MYPVYNWNRSALSRFWGRVVQKKKARICVTDMSVLCSSVGSLSRTNVFADVPVCEMACEFQNKIEQRRKGICRDVQCTLERWYSIVGTYFTCSQFRMCECRRRQFIWNEGEVIVWSDCQITHSLDRFVLTVPLFVWTTMNEQPNFFVKIQIRELPRPLSVSLLSTQYTHI